MTRGARSALWQPPSSPSRFWTFWASRRLCLAPPPGPRAAPFASFSFLALLGEPQALPGAVAVVTDDEGWIIAQSGLAESWIGRQAADVGPWRADGNGYGLSRSLDGHLRIADAARAPAAPRAG